MGTMSPDKRLAAWNNVGFAFLVAFAFTADRDIFGAERLPVWVSLLKFVVFFVFILALQCGWSELSNTPKKRVARLLFGAVLVLFTWTVAYVFSLGAS